MKLAKTFAFLVAACFCQGCNPPHPTVESKQERQIYDFELPTNAKNVVALPGDKGWHTFDLEIEGVNHHYLRHYRFGDTGTESMVEIVGR